MQLTENQFDSNGYWETPIRKIFFIPYIDNVDLFDQNGYDLTPLEQKYAYNNDRRPLQHRSHRMAIKQNWFIQESKIEGAVLNHSALFERKAYSGEALNQLKEWANNLPLLHKIIAMRPKWGLDFSMDYVDRQGNAFEVLHWEYDGFDFDEVSEVKYKMESRLLGFDFEQAAKDLLKRKDEWHGLDFFEQSDWKCKFFGIPRERFKMVIWE